MSARARTAREVLSRAASVLMKRGWCQRRFRDSRGRHCALGAIKVAAGRDLGLFSLARKQLLRVIGRRTGVSGWNDMPHRTGAEVVAALRKAARVSPASGRARSGRTGVARSSGRGGGADGRP